MSKESMRVDERVAVPQEPGLFIEFGNGALWGEPDDDAIRIRYPNFTTQFPLRVERFAAMLAADRDKYTIVENLEAIEHHLASIRRQSAQLQDQVANQHVKETEMRHITRVDPNELRRAIADMCRALDMPGSVAGRYDIYTAILKERERAITQQRCSDSRSSS